MKDYKWGIIGPGKIANKFAVALNLAGNASLEAVASRDASRARDFAEKFGAARYYDSYEQLADDPAIDAIYIATPHGYHAQQALLCLQKGKAVLCEKPMALSARQVQMMIKASVDNQAFLMEAMWTRFLPVMEKTLELIRIGRLGKLKYIRGDFGFSGPYHPDNRMYSMELGGGSLLDIGVYPLFLVLQLMGEPDIIKAAARLAPTGADEDCHAILQYRDGRSAVITSSFTCQTSITAEIAGEEGMILLPSPWYKCDSLTLLRPNEEAQAIAVEPMINGFEYQIREVHQCLEKGLLESPSMSHTFSLTLARVMDAIRKQIGVKYPAE